MPAASSLPTKKNNNGGPSIISISIEWLRTPFALLFLGEASTTKKVQEEKEANSHHHHRERAVLAAGVLCILQTAVALSCMNLRVWDWRPIYAALAAFALSAYGASAAVDTLYRNNEGGISDALAAVWLFLPHALWQAAEGFLAPSSSTPSASPASSSSSIPPTGAAFLQRRQPYYPHRSTPPDDNHNHNHNNIDTVWRKRA